MAHEDWEQIEREISEAEYMRYAAGGFARAANAARANNATFLTRTAGRALIENLLSMSHGPVLGRGSGNRGQAQPPIHFVQVMVTAPEVVIDSVQRVMAKVLFPIITVQPTPCIAWLHVVGVLGIFAVVPTHFTVVQPDAVVSLIFEGENVESTAAQVSSSTAQVAVVAGPVVCAMANGDNIKSHNAQTIRRIEKMGKVLMSGPA